MPSKSAKKRKQPQLQRPGAPIAPVVARGKRSFLWKLLALLVLLMVGGAGLRAVLGWKKQAQIKELSAEVSRAKRAGSWERVEEFARQWATLEPMNAEPWQEAAQAAMNLSDPGLAVAYLKEIPNPAPLDVYLQLGFLQMEATNNPLGTLETCETTLEYYPDDSETHERLLYFYTMTGQRNKVRDEALRAIRVGSDTLTTYAYLASRLSLTFTNGFETNLKWLQAEPDCELFEVGAVLQLPSYPLLMELARQNVPPGAEPKPIEYMQSQVAQLRSKYPNNIELLASETRSLCRAGDIEAVAQRLADAPAITLEDTRFWRFKGWLHSALEEWESAIAAYQKSLELDPLDWLTQIEYATALRASSGVEQATQMQELADVGKELTFAIQKSPVIFSLEPNSLYADMERYFRMCGDNFVAEGIRKQIDANP